MKDSLHTDDTEGYGGPQADYVGERESSVFKRILNGGPQADGGDGLHSPDTAKLMSTDEIGNERIIGQQCNCSVNPVIVV